MDPKPPRLRSIFAVWTAVGLFTMAQSAAQRSLANLPPLTLGVVVVPLVSVWLWALWTPFFWQLSTRFPLGRPGALAVHVTGALSVTFAEAAVSAWLVLPAVGLTPAGVVQVAARYAWMDTFAYFALVALEHAQRFRARSAEQEARAAQLESDLRAARLSALEGQLRPHLLFNALNTISSLVRAGEQTGAVSAVAALGDVLRGALRQTAPEVALSDELGLAERYLDLERARFGDALRFTVEAEPGTATAQVPSLLLQPLVENALKHGREKDGKATVQIRARRLDGRLRIEVADSGSGPAQGAPEGIGLANTRARLRHLYGDRARLQLLPGQGGGAVAVVELPLREAPHA